MKKKGLTTVELLISIAITGGLAVAVMSILYEATRVNSQLDREIESTRDLRNFFFTLEQFVSQTTQVVSCACTAAAAPNGCRNDTLVADAPAGVVFRAVYEDAIDPINVSGGNCLRAGGPALPGAVGIVARGCKKVLEIVYTPPTDGPPNALPGTVVLQVSEPNAAPIEIASLRNVTSFACGMSSNAAPLGTLSNRDFRVRADVKNRHSNINVVANADFESWVPGGALFNRGSRRSELGQITFRNFIFPGIQFGKLHTYANCVANGQPTGDAARCCSGYSDGATCQANCAWNDVIANPLAPPNVDARLCCARSTAGGASPGRCL